MTESDILLFDVTVVLRSYNDAPLLPRNLASLDAQRGVNLKLFVFESASTDGSQQILEEHGYERIEHLAPGAYHSSTVLNKGAESAETELVAFVNSDAILLSDDVLLKLARAIDTQPRCAGAFARQRVRPDASVMTRLDYYTAFDHREELGENFDYLSLVTSMIRRSCWEQIPFDPTLTYAEDYVWSARVKEKGWKLTYVKDATVEHSHDYSIKDVYRRAFGDAAAVAILAKEPPPRDMVQGVLIPCIKRILRDIKRLYRLGQIKSIWQLPHYRWAGFLGEWHGRRAAWDKAKADPGGVQPTIPSS